MPRAEVRALAVLRAAARFAARADATIALPARERRPRRISPATSAARSRRIGARRTIARMRATDLPSAPVAAAASARTTACARRAA